MALQWMILTYVVAAEAAIAMLLTLPAPKLLKNRFVSLISLILQPALFVVPFAGFQLLGPCFNDLPSLISFFSDSIANWFFLSFSELCADIYWKMEHRLLCTSDICTASERDRYEKSVSFSFHFLSFRFAFLGISINSFNANYNIINPPLLKPVC